MLVSREIIGGIDRVIDVTGDNRRRVARAYAYENALPTDIKEQRPACGRVAGNGNRAGRGDAGRCVGQWRNLERGEVIASEVADRHVGEDRATTD